MAVLGSSLVDLLYSARWYLVLIVVSAYVWQTYQSYRRLSHIKGPWLAQWSQLWLLGAIYRQQTHQELYQVTQKYGPLARIGPNTLATNSIELFRHMSSLKAGYKRSEWYIGFRLAPGEDNLFSIRDDKIHAKRRAQMNMGYTGKEDIDLESTVDKYVINLVDLICRKYVLTESDIKLMDFSEKANFFTMDVIVDLATGASFGDLTSDKDMHQYSKTMAEMQPVFSIIGVLPYLLTRIIQMPAIGKYMFPTSQDKFGMGKLIAIAKEKAAERFAPDQPQREKADLLQSFINHGLTEHETVSEALLLILGGSDTTASAIRAVMLHIMTSPQVYNKLRREIDHASTSGALSTPVVRDAEARTLPYLQAVILEGLRVSPPTGGLLSKVVPPQGDTVCGGVFVPGGTEVSAVTWAVLRDGQVFGALPDVFWPERWVGVGEEKYRDMARVVDLVFGHGKFKCIGMTVAWLELNKVFVELLRNFDWTVARPTKPWTTFCAGIIMHRDFYVRVTDRKVRS